jgi:hypothetical protein
MPESKSIICDDGNVYTGNFKYISNVPLLNGKGEILTKNGYKYEGYFIMGLMHGNIKLTDIKTEKSTFLIYDQGNLIID